MENEDLEPNKWRWMDDDFPDFNRVIFRFHVDFYYISSPGSCARTSTLKKGPFQKAISSSIPIHFQGLSLTSRGYVSFQGVYIFFFSKKSIN